MVLDGPDDLEQLQSPPGLKEAVLYADKLLAKTREIRVTSDAGTDFTYSCGEYPVMSQYGYADEPGRFDHGLQVADHGFQGDFRDVSVRKAIAPMVVADEPMPQGARLQQVAVHGALPVVLDVREPVRGPDERGAGA